MAHEASRSGEAPSPRALRAGAGAVVALQLALGLYAVRLQALFYERFGPFLDSASYLDKLVDLRVAALEGELARLAKQAMEATTVAFPWLLYAPLARALEPARPLAVWIQLAASLAASLALFRFLARDRREPVVLSVLFATSCSAVAASFHFAGGLADFRMDLLQYLFWTGALAAYLSARAAPSRARWALFGLFLGLVCLARSTSAVYVALLAALLVPLDAAAARPRARAALARWLLAGGVALATAGWFYAANFRYLRFYYGAWSSDVRARLPLAEALAHLEFALDHLGLPLLAAAALVALANLGAAWRAPGARSLGALDLRPLAFAAVPLGFLVVLGAAPNPFVSQVGVGGALLFLCAPTGGLAPRRSRAERWVLCSALVLAIGWHALDGYRIHTDPQRVWGWIPRRAGLDELLRALETEVRAGPPREVRWCAPHIGTANGPVVFNALVFDAGHRPLRWRGVEIGASTLYELLAPELDASAAGWLRLPGANDDERIASFVARIEEEAELLLVPSDTSELPERAWSNRFAREIARRALAGGGFVPVTGWIELAPSESVRLYRNSRRAAGAAPPAAGPP